MTLDLFDRPERDDQPKKPTVLRVAEINRVVRQQLESEFRDVRIEGELSDVKRAASGHVYFTLNDEREPAHDRLRAGGFARAVDPSRVERWREETLLRRRIAALTP